MKKNPNYRRALPDRSQRIRRAFQLGFLALNVWICIEFYKWVRFFEVGRGGAAPSRPPGVEGWLPIASLMNLKVLFATGELPSIHPAGIFLLLSFAAMSWIFRKSFCGWLCPVGIGFFYSQEVCAVNGMDVLKYVHAAVRVIPAARRPDSA